MKRSRFSEEQIIAILKEQEAGMATADVCRRHGISSATFYKWKSKYGGLEVSEARRLWTLEEENSRLKKLLAEAVLDNVVLKDLSSGWADVLGGKAGPRSNIRRCPALSCGAWPSLDSGTTAHAARKQGRALDGCLIRAASTALDRANGIDGEIVMAGARTEPILAANFGMEGKTIVVIGGRAGIGLATAELFLGIGAHVVIADIADGTGVTAQFLGEWLGTPDRISGIVADIHGRRRSSDCSTASSRGSTRWMPLSIRPASILSRLSRK